MLTTITILGCGASSGVPVIGCDCAVCKSDNPKNKRSRVSLYVESDSASLLIDTSPDLRAQVLTHNIRKIDAVLYTHEHGDHSHGIDDLRAFNFMNQASIPAYGDERTMELLKQRFAYIFAPPMPQFGWFRASLTAHTVEPIKRFRVKGVSVLPFHQIHGKINTLGYRIGDVAYSTDLNMLDDTAFVALRDLSLWIVDCQGMQPSFSHSHLEQTLAWIKRVKPKRAILTHMGHDLEYDTLKAMLPPHVEPAYDGLQITV